MSNQPDPAQITAAVDALRRGEAIGLPTETVYGLAAAARDPEAVRRIFTLKGRPSDHPLIVHLASVDQLSDWAQEIPATALALAQAFWPGPMTLILKRKPEVLDLITGGQDTVGLRLPSHPVAQAVLRAFGDGLAAPSANRFGRISPTTATHVREEFGSALPLVLDGGASPIGLESTIIDLSAGVPRVLRPGQIDLDRLAAVLGQTPQIGQSVNVPRVSGSLASHYAPAAQAWLLSREQLCARASEPGSLLLALATLPEGGDGIALPEDAAAYGAQLYASLRALDARRPQRILIEQVPQSPAWWAVRDRLQRATHRAD